MSEALWREAIDRMLKRIDDTARRVGEAYPHWADPQTGEWTTTPDGDWTGGYWVGLNWLAAKATGEQRYRSRAAAAMHGLRQRISGETVFKSFPIYYGAVVGDKLFADASARALALECARTYPAMFRPQLGLVPLGSQAEEGAHLGPTETSIDSLQTAPFLLWAAQASGDEALRAIGVSHARKVLRLHLRADDSFIQSTSLDPQTGDVVRHYTHKGYSDTSTWGRAQAWGMLFSIMSYLAAPAEAGCLDAAERGARWWIDHAPADRVAFWDFDDPAIPQTERDTAATAIASLALLKLAPASRDPAAGRRYGDAAAQTVRALVTHYLTPAGMLTESCFNKRRDARPHDAATRCEFILAEYYLFESLLVLAGIVPSTAL